MWSPHTVTDPIFFASRNGLNISKNGSTLISATTPEFGSNSIDWFIWIASKISFDSFKDLTIWRFLFLWIVPSIEFKNKTFDRYNHSFLLCNSCFPFILIRCCISFKIHSVGILYPIHFIFDILITIETCLLISVPHKIGISKTVTNYQGCHCKQIE